MLTAFKTPDSFRRLCGCQSGQATVEFTALLPLVILVFTLVLHVAVIGYGWWLTASAAKAGARAHALGLSSKKAVKSKLPSFLEKGLVVNSDGVNRIKVSVKVPTLVSVVKPVRVNASSRFEVQS